MFQMDVFLKELKLSDMFGIYLNNNNMDLLLYLV